MGLMTSSSAFLLFVGHFFCSFFKRLGPHFLSLFCCFDGRVMVPSSIFRRLIHKRVEMYAVGDKSVMIVVTFVADLPQGI